MLITINNFIQQYSLSASCNLLISINQKQIHYSNMWLAWLKTLPAEASEKFSPGRKCSLP